MNVYVKLDAYTNNLQSARLGLTGVAADVDYAILKIKKTIAETEQARSKSLKSWLRRSVSENDDTVCSAGTPPLAEYLSQHTLFERRSMLWEHWGLVRADALQKHDIQDPGIDAAQDEILKWCADIRHVLSDVARFEGMSAKISGRTKIKKLISAMDESGGLNMLEQAWSVASNEPADLDMWLSWQDDIYTIVNMSAISKDKKEVQLLSKKLHRLESKLQELEQSKAQISFWISVLSDFIKLRGTKYHLDDIEWFLECIRAWTYELMEFSMNIDLVKKPDYKLLKKAHSRLKIV